MTGLTRRTVLKASAAVAGSFGLGWLANAAGAALAAPEPKILKATPTTALLTGSTPTQKVLTYGDAGMPPVLRMTKGKPFAARLVNGLDEPTTIHWHGVRVPNKMDGVPFMIQPYVYTGDHFDYAFTPPDAGTFWYHPHCNTLEQMGHGLTGVIVVENPGDPAFDAEVVLNLRDWRLDGDGRFLAPFRPRDAARGGTYGTVRTANWQAEPRYDAPAGGLVRHGRTLLAGGRRGRRKRRLLFSARRFQPAAGAPLCQERHGAAGRCPAAAADPRGRAARGAGRRRRRRPGLPRGRSLPKADVLRIVDIFQRHGATAKISSIHVNGWFGGYDKLSTSRLFLDRCFGIDIDNDRESIVFVGDSPNDAPMFGFFPNSVGVANVLDFGDELPASPAFVTAGRGADGFAEVASALIAAKG